MFNKSRLISKFLALFWRESEAGSEKHISEGAHRPALVSDDSEKPFKGCSEKIVLCNYRDLCLYMIYVSLCLYIYEPLRRFTAILELSEQRSQQKKNVTSSLDGDPMIIPTRSIKWPASVFG